MRAGIGAGKHRNLVARETVDQRDFQLVRIGARLVVIDLHELRGARAADHHACLVERADARRERLIHRAGRHRGSRRARRRRGGGGCRRGKRALRVPGWQFSGQLAISRPASSKRIEIKMKRRTFSPRPPSPPSHPSHPPPFFPSPPPWRSPQRSENSHFRGAVDADADLHLARRRRRRPQGHSHLADTDRVRPRRRPARRLERPHGRRDRADERVGLCRRRADGDPAGVD